MCLDDPFAVYNAESNMDAILFQRFLESEGIKAHVIEDNSLAGEGITGNLPGIHKAQVWINRHDAERVSHLLAEYERRRIERDRTKGK